MLLTHLGQTFPNRVAEWMLGMILFSWGLILIRPEATFDYSLSYVGLRAIATEWFWAIACLSVGAIRIIALFINGLWVPPTYHLRSITSGMSILFWFSIVYGMAVSGAATTGLAVYPWLLLAEIFCLFRTARDYRISLLTAG